MLKITWKYVENSQHHEVENRRVSHIDMTSMLKGYFRKPFIHAHVIPNQYTFLLPVEHTKYIYICWKMSYNESLDPSVIQNMFFCVPQKKEITTWEWVNDDFLNAWMLFSKFSMYSVLIFSWFYAITFCIICACLCVSSHSGDYFLLPHYVRNKLHYGILEEF